MDLQVTDLLAINNLIADYVLAIDNREIDRFADLWAADAVVRVRRDRAGLGAPLRGREAILAAYAGWFERNPHSEPGTFMRHFCTNPRLEPDGEDVVGETAMLSVGQRLDGDRVRMAPSATGAYRDRFIRTADGWRFAERLIAWDPPEVEGTELPVELYGTLPPPDA